MSTFRRKLMAAIPAGEQPLPSYVTDGLLLHLDGIDKGNTSGRWESLVGSAYYTLTTHSVVEDNAVVMDGAGAISGTGVDHITWNAGTIEVVMQKLTDSFSVIIYADFQGLGLVGGSTGVAFGVGTDLNNQWSLSESIPQEPFTISLNIERAILNGVSCGVARSKNNWGNSSAACPIGGRLSGTNKFYSNVRIFAIRKYNRLLTEAEMLQNQRVDNIRFNLGLNI